MNEQVDPAIWEGAMEVMFDMTLWLTSPDNKCKIQAMLDAGFWQHERQFYWWVKECALGFEEWWVHRCKDDPPDNYFEMVDEFIEKKFNAKLTEYAAWRVR